MDFRLDKKTLLFALCCMVVFSFIDAYQDQKQNIKHYKQGHNDSSKNLEKLVSDAFLKGRASVLEEIKAMQYNPELQACILKEFQNDR